MKRNKDYNKFPKDVSNGLRGFFRSYRKQVKFLKELTKEKRGMNEIILLSCCYIDQLSRCFFPLEKSTKRAFEKILLQHSSERKTFNLVSVPDLAIDLLWMAETASNWIPKPGRLRSPGKRYLPIIKMVDDSGISLTKVALRNFLFYLYKKLKYNYRIHPRQTKAKPQSEDISAVSYLLNNATEDLQKLKPIENQVSNVVQQYTYSSILYLDYRCKAVHEPEHPILDKRKFWSQQRTYFSACSSYIMEDFYTVEFPAAFLINCVSSCIDSLETSYIAQEKFPIEIWQMICTIDQLNYLDEETIEEAKPLKLKLE